MKAKLIVATCLTLAALVPTSAQTLKPGLWEIKVLGGVGSGRAMAEHIAMTKKEVAKLPAAERKQMEAAMAAHDANGVQLTDDSMTIKHCIGRGEATEFHKLVVQEGDCTVKGSPMVAGVVKMHTRCTTPQMTGTAIAKFQGDTGYTMEMTSSMNMDGENFTSKVSTVGRWLGANCGTVKPAARKQ